MEEVFEIREITIYRKDEDSDYKWNLKAEGNDGTHLHLRGSGEEEPDIQFGDSIMLMKLSK